MADSGYSVEDNGQMEIFFDIREYQPLHGMQDRVALVIQSRVLTTL